jgi:O-methyltransferase involved in polyketide biosynthesis
MTEPLIRNVSDTAFWIAHHRAIETERPDALFRDPLAARLAGEHGEKIAAAMPTRRMIAGRLQSGPASSTNSSSPPSLRESTPYSTSARDWTRGHTG